jgi:hypothetical protein
MTAERIKEIQDATAYPESVSVQQALLKVWNECEQHESLPPKIERIIAVVAKRWGKEYGGSTVGILGQDAIEICEKYGIDWENYR